MSAIYPILSLTALAVFWGGILSAVSDTAANFSAAPDHSIDSRLHQNPEVLENSVGMRFIKCPAGEFQMGSPVEEQHRFGGEQQHLVRISEAFWLGMEEVSVSQFRAVMGKSLSNNPDGNIPEYQVTWYDADDFCRKISELDAERAAGRSYRLPTEAEWEYACRAGTQTVYSWGDDPAEGENHAWSARNSNRSHRRVGSRQPNAWGFYDMHGNVWEWCSDWYDDLPATPLTDPKGPATGEYRVLRGGAYDSPVTYLRAATRVPWEPAGSDARGNNVGFRVVLVIAAEEPRSENK